MGAEHRRAARTIRIETWRSFIRENDIPKE